MPEYVQNRDIDREKWDDCIASACFETIYPYSWYLDLTARNWDGIIEGDYKAVFPVTWNIKYGIHYIHQPLLNQQLGLFTREAPDPGRLHEFLVAIPPKYKHVEINLNASNVFSSHGFRCGRRVNYELDLSEPYGKIRGNYSTNTARNIRKAEGRSLLVKKIDARAYMDLKTGNRKGIRDNEQAERLTRIFSALPGKNSGEIWGAYHEDKLCSAVAWAYSRTRRIYLNSVSTDAGKELRAMFLLVDDCIKNHAGQSLVLDFEGSMIPGIARFFEGFGASMNNYTRIRRSAFPLGIFLK